jgi:putative transposase
VVEKNSDHLTHHEKITLIEKGNPKVSVKLQAEALNISRSSLYYKPVPISREDIDLMNLIDKIYTKCPFYGARQIKRVLKREHKIIVSRSHIRRLMKQMGLEAIYPKPNLSKKNIQNPTYPYLLRNLTIDHPNQVWGTDITYIRLNQGFCYLVAIMDWYSRYVVAWELSNSLDIEFVIRNLNNALKIAVPEIENSDQGSHFTSSQRTSILKENDIKISMDGRGRCMDNIFTERLWRSVKYENVYIKSYNNIAETRAGLTEYFEIYNNERPHSSLDDLTPVEVYFNKII